MPIAFTENLRNRDLSASSGIARATSTLVSRIGVSSSARRRIGAWTLVGARAVGHHRPDTGQRHRLTEPGRRAAGARHLASARPPSSTRHRRRLAATRRPSRRSTASRPGRSSGDGGPQDGAPDAVRRPGSTATPGRVRRSQGVSVDMRLCRSGVATPAWIRSTSSTIQDAAAATADARTSSPLGRVVAVTRSATWTPFPVKPLAATGPIPVHRPRSNRGRNVSRGLFQKAGDALNPVPP